MQEPESKYTGAVHNRADVHPRLVLHATGYHLVGSKNSVQLSHFSFGTTRFYRDNLLA